MPEAIQPGTRMLRKLRRALNFARGSRLLAAVIVSLLFAALLALSPARRMPQPAWVVQASAAADMPEAALNGEDDKGIALTTEMRAALDFVSKRYRVSAEALAPVFRAAQAAGRQTGLDPLLIIAVIAIESKFNPFAESIVGAQGLMQIVPHWHQDKIPEGGTLTIFDPATNVQVGAQVLRDSISRMGGLIPGLQQFAGALDDPEHGYANKILAEKQRLVIAARRGSGT